MILRLYHRLLCFCSAFLAGGVRCLIYCLLSVPVLAYGQTEADTLGKKAALQEKHSPVDEEKDAKGLSSSSKKDGGANNSSSNASIVFRNVTFSPRDVQLQKRYSPRENDSLFVEDTKQWWRRFYFGVGAGIQGLSDNVSSVHHATLNGYLGYRFSPIHSLRAHGSMITYSYANGHGSTRSIGVGMDYLANLSAFIFGYNRNRMIDVSSVVGGGIRITGTGLPHRINPYAYIGFHADMHLSSNFSLFLEPQVGVQREMSVLFERTNSEKWNLMYGISGGIQARLDRRTNYYTEADSIYGKFFFDSSIGLVIPGREGGILHRSGVGYQAAMGMWLNPMLGLRIGAQAQSAYWSSAMRNLYGASVRESKEQILFSGRAEVILNPLNFIKSMRDRKEGRDFNVNVLLGGDFGWNMKSHVPNTTSGGFQCYYYGFTGALQAMYRIAKPGTYIFFEPRYLAAMYSVPYRNTQNSLFTVEHNMSLNIGTRVYLTNPTFNGRGEGGFIPHWWAGVDLGGVKWQRSVATTTGGLGINPTLGLSVGYDWKPMASFRAQLSYQRLYDTHTAHYSGYEGSVKKGGRGLWDSAYDVMDLRLAYMLNLNNFFQGYSKDRPFNLWWTAGPTVSYAFHETDTWVEGQNGKSPKLSLLELKDSRKGKISPGLSTSLMASMRLAPQYDITVEAMGQYNFVNGVNPGNRPRLNNLKYGLTVGSRYHFLPGQMNYRGQEGSRFFYDSSFSWATSSLYNAFRLGGTQYAMSMGMWFNSVVGARLGLNAQTLKHQSFDTKVRGVDMRKSKGMANAGARLELLVNPLNFFNKWRNKEGGHDFELNMLLGGELGGIVKAKQQERRNLFSKYYGFTGAMQFMYRINNPGTYIFVEPRFLSALYSVPYLNTGIESTIRDNMFSVGVGTRVYLTNPSFNPYNSKDMVPHWWAGLDFGGVKVQHTTSLHQSGGIGFNPSLSLSVGYDWKPLVSFRAQLAYQRISESMVSSYSGLASGGKVLYGSGLWDSSYDMMDLRLGYMLNINNFFQGYDANRKFNLWLIAGPALSWVAGESNSWVESQDVKIRPMEKLYLQNSRRGCVSPAITASMMASLKVAKDVDVTAEVLGQYNFITGTNPGQNGIVNNLKYNFAVGARYHFEQELLRRFFNGVESKPWQRGWQLEAQYGWAVPADTGLGLRGSGSSMFVSAGYWFNGLLGVRLGLGGRQVYWNKKSIDAVNEPVSGLQVHAPYEKYNSQFMVGGRAELMLNPLNLLASRRKAETAPKWDLNMSLGLNFGGLSKISGLTKGYIGFTTSMSALYRLSNTAQLFVEPRYDVFNYSVHNSAMNFDESYSDKMFTISVGTRISRPVGETKDSKRPHDVEKMSHRGWWGGLSIGGSKMLQCIRLSTGATFIQPSVGLTGGYDFDRQHGVRAHISYDIQSRVRPNQPYGVMVSDMLKRYYGTMNSTLHQMDVRLLYMLNVTNLWTGYDKRNALNMYFEFGPTFSSILSESNELAEGEMMGGSDFRYMGKSYSGNCSMGMAAGILTALRLTNRWDLTAEVVGQYHFNRTYMPEYYPRFLNGIKINFGIGTRYNF